MSRARTGISQYEKLEIVGQGNFGVAWKARHKLDGQLYCIKIIPMSAKEEAAATLKEADLLRSLDHPNIIAYKECFIDDDGALCIVTSFCEEGDLSRRVKDLAKSDDRFTENEIMDMFIQIASALMYIHGKKILHRDLKSQNIFIARGGIMVLGDFGISKVLERTDQFAHTVTGTPYYMAPEICSSQPYSNKSDIWSLGILLYELCTLKRAFPADNLLSLIHMIVRGTYPKIEGYNPGLTSLVDALLTRDPGSRPSLQQVFQMPFVQQHVQRYAKEEKRRAKRMGNAIHSRRKEREEFDDQLRAGTIKMPEFDKLSPPDLKKKRQEIEQQKRELDLQLATLTMHQARKLGEERKKVLAEANAGRGDQANPWDVDKLSESTKRRGNAGNRGGMDNSASMVNIGTMPEGTISYYERDNRPVGRTGAGAGETVLFGSVLSGAGGGAGGRTAGAYGNNTYAGTDGVNMGSVNYATTQGGMPFTPPSMMDTFEFGGADTRATLPAFRRKPSMNSSMPQSPATPQIGQRRDARSFPDSTPPPNKKLERKESSQSDYSEYESDFETYDGEDMQGIHQHRMKLLSNMEELERTGWGSTWGADQPAVFQEEKQLNSFVKRDKTQALREECEKILGYHFGDIYLFLRHARSSSAGVVDEKQIQQQLVDMLGRPSDEAVLGRLMQGCYMVDQLVFQESMWSNGKGSARAAAR